MSTDPDHPTNPLHVSLDETANTLPALPLPQMQTQDRGQLTERWGGDTTTWLDEEWFRAQVFSGRPLEGTATRTLLAIEDMRRRLGLPE